MPTTNGSTSTTGGVCLGLVLCLFSLTPGWAKPAAATRRVEVAGRYDVLTGGFPNWVGFLVQGGWTVDENTTLRAELSRHERFGDQVIYLTAGVTQTLSKLWYVDVDGATSFGGFFLPRYRGDVALNKKWENLPGLVTRIGMMASAAADFHRDTAGTVGLMYYFPSPWVADAGFRLNFSYPGAVPSYASFVAVTYTGIKKTMFVGRVGFATEAYQITNQSTVLSSFASNEASLTVKHVFPGGWGFDLGGEYYGNPYYVRGGVRVGITYEF